MKKIVLALILLATTAAGCTAQTQKSSSKATNSNATSSESKTGTVAITKAEFLKKVVNYETTPDKWEFLGDKPVLVDFYASWCGPCKMIAPILEELAAEYRDQIVIYKVNTESEPELAAAFGIRSIPTLLFIPKDGDPQMSQGAMNKQQFQEAINKILLGKQ